MSVSLGHTRRIAAFGQAFVFRFQGCLGVSCQRLFSPGVARLLRSCKLGVLHAARQPQAHQKRGYPKDKEVFDKDPHTIIRPSTCCDPSDLKGGGLNTGSCQLNLRNICKNQLRDESDSLFVAQEDIHSALVRLTDHVGAVASRRSEVVVMFKTSEEPFTRRFALLAFGVFSPKVQMWCLATWSDDNLQRPDGAIVDYPFKLSLSSRPCRVSPATLVPHLLTSDELALDLARSRNMWEYYLLDTELPGDEPHLRTMIVKGGARHMFDREVTKPKSSRNRDLEDARSVASRAGRISLDRAARRALSRGKGLSGRGGAARGRGRGRNTEHPPALQPPSSSGREGADATNDKAPLALQESPVAIDDLPTGEGDFDGIAIADLEEVVDALMAEGDDDHIVEIVGGAEEPIGVIETAASEPAATTPAPPGLGQPLVVGPSKYGYFRHTLWDRDICRISGPFNNSSMAVKCYLHPKCTLAIAASRMPSVEHIKEWALAVRRPEPGESSAAKEALRTEHLRLLRALRDAAQASGAGSSGDPP